MEILKNWLSNTSNKAEAGSHQEVTTVSDVKDSTVEIIGQKQDIDAGVAIGGNVSGGNVAGRDIFKIITYNFFAKSDKSKSEQEIRRCLENYLIWLMDDCGSLGWLESDFQKDKSEQVRLDGIYTALLTTTLKETKKDHYAADKGSYSAVEMLNLEKNKNLVIAGAPSSGKSAFVNFVSLCMAGELLGDKHCNLALLTQPLPDKEGKPQQEKQPWQHGALVPLRIILRDFASSEYFPKNDKEAVAQSLLNFIESMIGEKKCAGYFPILENCLSDGQVLVMFDGLDEVPEADKRRERMKKCIEDFRSVRSKNRFLVTVRPYAYQKPEWQLLRFKETELAKFSRGQICLFIDSWYRDYDKLEAEVVRQRAADLKRNIFERPALNELAERPLLLTLITFLHRDRHTDLPDQRAELYESLLDLLILKWDKERFGIKDANEASEKQPTLCEYLRVGSVAIRRVLERLAFEAHALQAAGENGVADIAASRLHDELFKLAEKVSDDFSRKINPIDLGCHLRDRVGILNLRGGDNDSNSVYSFPHRSFQEYLAASYIRRGEKLMYEQYPDLKKKKWYDLAAYLIKTDTDRWREAVVLLGAIHAKDEQMADLINALIAGIEQGNDLSQQQNWCLRLAGEILAENIKQNTESYGIEECLEALQILLPKLLDANTLPAAERVTAGRHLAKIGDIRPEIMDVDAMRFCMIPKGEFYLGGDDKAYGAGKNHGRQTIDYDYALARFPVTVAQYRQFVEATQHQVENENCLRGLDNTPVVWVSWDEAIKFCDWLTLRWQQAGYLAKNWRVDLPSEAEWEKAAKGGLQIPVKPERMTVAVMTGSQADLTDNPLAQRFYPWGNEIDHEKLNYEGRVNGVSTPACYPLGQSPYGCEDMAGNVWEWTRSAYEENYPVTQSEWLKRNARNQSAVRRVLRGGAFFNNDDFVRCAARYSSSPDYRDLVIGFRVVLCPHTSER